MTQQAVHPDSLVAPPVVPAIPPAPPVAPPVTPPATPPVVPATPPATPPAPDAPIGFDPPAPPAAPTPPQADSVVVYEPTGDKGLDVALRYVGQRGFGPDHPAIEAARKGDFTELEKALGALGDKAQGFKEYVDLAKDAVGRLGAAAKSKSEAAAKAVHDTVGGKEQWAAIQAWAAQNADQAEKDQLNAAFKAGGVAATAAAKYLSDLYKQHGKAAPKSAVKADTSAAPPAGATALSPREYGFAVRELNAKLGARMEGSPEYADLKARRAAFRG